IKIHLFSIYWHRFYCQKQTFFLALRVLMGQDGTRDQRGLFLLHIIDLLGPEAVFSGQVRTNVLRIPMPAPANAQRPWRASLSTLT
ncbi:MAG: hypothetical protein IJ164_05520, partial [Duodenibacillus sp.]|nr:hypothetical protein [Duodenibacillus sp.]